MSCAQCNKGFNCGCQKTKAGDGRTVHKACLTIYNSRFSNKLDSLTRTLNMAKGSIIK